MGAETVVYVKILKPVVEWIEVQSITFDAAIKEVKEDTFHFQVLDAQYDKPDEWGKEG